jgi:hypothetical protein
MQFRSEYNLTTILALIFCFGSGLAYGSPTESTEVKIAVEKSGLKWTGPCSGRYSQGSGAAATEVEMVDDLSGSVFLPPGRYNLLVACPSTEGTLRQHLSLAVKGKTIKKTMKMKAGFLLAIVKRDGQERDAEIFISDASGQEIQRGAARVALVVPPGRLQVMAQVSGPSPHHGLPIMGRSQVQVRAGKKSTTTINASDGTLNLKLTANGKRAKGVAALRFSGKRERLLELTPGTPALVPPGTYDLVTQLDDSHDSAEELTRGIVIRAQKKKTVKVNHQVSTIRPVIKLDGKEIKDGAEVEIDVFLGAAPKPFNTVEPGELIRVKPGSYRLSARMQKKKLDDGTVWDVESSVKTRAKKSKTVHLDLTPARLQVETTLAGEALAMPVSVYLQKNQAPIATRTSNLVGEVSFNLAPGTHYVGTELPGTKGKIKKIQEVYLKRGASRTRALNLEAGKVIVQVFERQIAVSARVAFYAESDNSSKENPYAVVPAGQEIYLPPGVYGMTVHRKGLRKEFSAIRVAAGRQLERQLELQSPP